MSYSTHVSNLRRKLVSIDRTLPLMRKYAEIETNSTKKRHALEKIMNTEVLRGTISDRVQNLDSIDVLQVITLRAWFAFEVRDGYGGRMTAVLYRKNKTLYVGISVQSRNDVDNKGFGVEVAINNGDKYPDMKYGSCVGLIYNYVSGGVHHHISVQSNSRYPKYWYLAQYLINVIMETTGFTREEVILPE